MSLMRATLLDRLAQVPIVDIVTSLDACMDIGGV